MITLAFALSFIVLIFTVLNCYFIGYGLGTSFLIFVGVSLLKGKKITEIKDSAWKGGKRAFVVLKVFILIGLVTASWLISGTIPAIVYYSLKVMNPNFYILFAFLACAAVSYMLGTSLGTASTIGVVLIIMAKGGDINLNLAAGAMLSGIYFGDRTSPMSSAANLIANQTDTKLYEMLKGFRKTTLVPFILVSLIYLVLSFSNPLTMTESNISQLLRQEYTINIVVLIPAIIMLVLSTLQYDVKKSMLISVIAGSIIAIVIQGATVGELFHTLIFGFKLQPDNPLVDLIKGGGLISMLKTGLVIFISCAMAGLLENLSLFEKISNVFKKYHKRSQIFSITALTSFISACFGGNQSIAVVMTSEIMKSVYSENKVDKYKLANDISNTAILFAPMIPWNVAVLVPSITWGVEPFKIIPFAFYLMIPFVYNFIRIRMNEDY